MITPKGIPAIPYLAPIRQWAVANNLPFFTWKQQSIAIARYKNFRAQLN